MGRTKVVGIAGRFGARYGATLRKKWKEIMEKRYSEYRCPFCGAKRVMKRISVGIWYCPSCGRVWAGGAYTPETEVGKVVTTVKKG